MQHASLNLRLISVWVNVGVDSSQSCTLRILGFQEASPEPGLPVLEGLCLPVFWELVALGAKLLPVSASLLSC